MPGQRILRANRAPFQRLPRARWGNAAVIANLLSPGVYQLNIAVPTDAHNGDNLDFGLAVDRDKSLPR